MWGGGGHYQRWVDLLDRWGGGEQVDPAALPALAWPDLSADGWERLTNRLTDALSRRLQGWARVLGRDLSEAGDEFTAGRALAQARRGLSPIRALAAHPGLPTELTEKLLGLVDAQVHSAQRTLEEQVEAARRGGVDRRLVEARRRSLRNTDLSRVTTEAPARQPAGDWPAAPVVAARRRVIVD